MAAYVQHEFRRGFVLREENLRRINEIIRKRANFDSESRKLEIHVKRVDAFSYKASTIDEVLSEENSDADMIKSITFECVDKESDYFINLDFDASDGVYLRLVGPDRDEVFLLFSDLKAYVEAEVAKAWKYDIPTIKAAIVVLSMFMLFGGVMYTIAASVDSDALKKAILSNDVNEKLNYVLTQRQRTPYEGFVLMGGLSVSAIMSAFVVPRTLVKGIRYLFPSNEFLIGKQIQRYAKRMTLRQNLFWGVVVAAAVGIATGYLLER
jgi:hypothetical protein